jgi:hypothetical protein
MDYRAYILNDAGKIINVREIVARDDAEAIAQAKQYVDGCDIELWQQGRKVKLLPSKDQAGPRLT